MYPTVFGDLHLDHVRHWRDTELGKLGIALEYPLWKVPHASLMRDLEESNVEYVLSASTRDGIEVGSVFGRDFSDRIERDSLDAFGERMANGDSRREDTSSGDVTDRIAYDRTGEGFLGVRCLVRACGEQRLQGVQVRYLW
jgi:hypothetical protein